MEAPTADELSQMIEAGRIQDAVHCTRHLSPLHIYRDLIFLAANENPSETYLQFVLAAADHRSGTIDEVGFIESAQALLVTALAPLDNAFQRAFDLHLRSIELMRLLLLENVHQISFFRTTPGRELDADTEQDLRAFAEGLKAWRGGPGWSATDPS